MMPTKSGQGFFLFSGYRTWTIRWSEMPHVKPLPPIPVLHLAGLDAPLTRAALLGKGPEGERYI